MKSKLKIVKDAYKESLEIQKNPTDAFLIEELEYVLARCKSHFTTGLFPFWTEKEFKQTEKFLLRLKSMLY